MTRRERDILELIENDPLTSQQAIADRLGLSRSAVAGHIMKMTAKGVIKGRAYVLGQASFAVAIGGATMDVHGRPSSALRRHDSNPGAVSTSPGGVARNVAENLARLGIDCRLLTAVGRDHYGDELLRRGREAGIDMGRVLRTGDHPTPTYLSILDRRGDLDVAISDLAALRALSVDYLRSHARLLASASLLVLDTNLTRDVLDYVCTKYRTTPVFVDTVSAPKAARIRPHLSAVHTITPSLAEAREICGLPLRGTAGLRAAARWFHDEGVQRVFITLGKRGVFYSDGERSGTLRAIDPTSAGSTNGVGDAFTAAIAAAWLQSWPLERSVSFALAAARHTLNDSDTVSETLTAERLLELAAHHDAA